MDISSLSPIEFKKLKLTFLKMKEKAKEDPVFFFNNFLRIYNPKDGKEKDIPFKTFPFQNKLIRQILEAYKNGEDIFVDKTREMGVTYVSLGLFLWLWLYEPGFTCLIGSRKEDFVDNRRGGLTGNKESSLFGKLDYMVTRLPNFMLPDNWNKSKHFNYMSLINPDNGNVIQGESSNPDFSRGGRYSVVFLDEFAFWENSWQVWGATADTTNCRIVVTTPGHKPGKAKRLRFGLDNEKIKIIKVPYYLDPRKTPKWLEEQKIKRSEEDFNREIMMNWELSLRGRIYPEIEKAQYGDYPFIPNQQLYVSGDYGLDGTCFLFWQQNPQNGKWRLIDSFHYENEPIEYSFPLFGRPINSKFVYTDSQIKAIDFIKSYPPAIHFGDPSINKRSGNEDKKSDRDKLAEIGVYVISYTKTNTIEYRVNTMKVAIKNGIEVNENDRNYYALEGLKAYRWKTYEDGQENTSAFKRPIHDWCLVGETKIRTLNGWKEIKDMVGESNFWVWSYSNIRKRLIPTLAKRCWMSGKNEPTILIGLDDGHSIRCTPDHRFMMRDGSYKQAQDLNKGDSLMSFYEKNDDTYRVLMKGVSKSYELRHQKKCVDCGTTISRKAIRCVQCNSGTRNHRVRFIQKDNELRDVFDIEVPGTHNFVAEGVVVHNCSHIATSAEYFFVNIEHYTLETIEEPKWAQQKRGWLTSKYLYK